MKKTSIIIISILSMVLLSSFLGFLFGNSPSPKRKMAYKITRQLSKKFDKKYKLYFAGISEEDVAGKYNTIGIELYCDRILTRDQGRILLLNCAHDALEAFNSYPPFKQHMVNSEFKNDNIIINIYIQPPHISYVYHPDFSVFSFYSDILRYITDVPNQKGFYHSEEKESYEEALRIVEGQKGKLR